LHLRFAAVAAGAAVVYPAHGVSFASTAARRALGIIDRLDEEGGVAVTFDDGPRPGGTLALLDVLEGWGAEARLFLSGMRRYPELAREIVDRGHTVGLHGDRDRLHSFVGPLLRTASDLASAEATLPAATGAPPPSFRAPYGIFLAALATVRCHGWVPVLWTRWGRDWEARATATSIPAALGRALDGGELLPLQDADHYSSPELWPRTVAVLPFVLERLQRRGLKPVSLATARLTN